MTKEGFIADGEALSARAQVIDGLHAYFCRAASRLHRSCELFGLFAGDLGDVLEVGPFYGYTPFLLRPHSSSYTVLEGDDPAVYPLVPLYEQSSIAFSYVDFFELFGPTHSSRHALPLADSSYDTILCWETMEHFNFNPVKFVRELYRVLKPGGRVCITVPNRASFQAIYSLLFGKGEESATRSYYKFENYESNGKKAFYGFHWREYTSPELAVLFADAGFKLQGCRSFTVFHDRGKLTLSRQLARLLLRLGTLVLPRFGTNVYLIARK
jgi:SAM-dependent methyltransferase